jgi:hypothetical protein
MTQSRSAPGIADSATIGSSWYALYSIYTWLHWRGGDWNGLRFRLWFFLLWLFWTTTQ